MAPKKPNVKLNVKVEKKPVKAVKASVKAAKPSAKIVVKKEVEKKVAAPKKVVGYERVQTAEGWKRMKRREMMKK